MVNPLNFFKTFNIYETKTLKIIQVSTQCLSQFSYIIHNDSVATLIDPMSPPTQYLNYLKSNNLSLSFVLLTHIHADFVAAHFNFTVPIYMGNLQVQKDNLLKTSDNQKIKLSSDSEITVLHTPGHTVESTCFQIENYIFTGDCLFLGEIGRVDLSQSKDQSAMQQAMFQSIQRLKSLSDDLIVLPGHGAGSACGGSIQAGDKDTLGNQKLTNKWFSLDEANFKKNLGEGVDEPPAYFARVVSQNVNGVSTWEQIWEKSNKELSYEDLKDTFIFDLRRAHGGFFIKNATFMNPALSVSFFANYVQEDSQISVICEAGDQEEMISRLTRVGLTHFKGYYCKIDSIPKEDKLPIDTITVEEFAKMDDVDIIDVRGPGEFKKIHITGAKNLPLQKLNQLQDQIDKQKKVYLHCQSGQRALIACSYLKTLGFDNIVNIDKGINGLKALNYQKIEETVCPLSKK